MPAADRFRRRRGITPGRLASVLALLGMVAGAVAACSGPPPLAPRPDMAASGASVTIHASGLMTGDGGAPFAGSPAAAALAGSGLSVRRALVLRADDRRFGGWSGLAVQPLPEADGGGVRLSALSDRGFWLQATLSPTTDTVTNARMGILAGLDGQPLDDPLDRDAEELVALPDGGWLVAFERRHRLWHYPPAEPPFSAAPRPVAMPSAALSAPDNGGLEAVALLPDGRLAAALEGPREAATTQAFVSTQAFVGAQAAAGAPEAAWSPGIALPLSGGQRPTALAVAGDRLLVVERSFSLATGFTGRLRDLGPLSALNGDRLGDPDAPPLLALHRPPLNDNFEALATLPPPPGGDAWRLFLLTDDNYNGLQRTLLIEAAWLPPVPADQ